MSRKLYTDTVHLSPEAAATAFGAIITDPLFMAGQDPAALIRSNITSADPDLPPFGFDEETNAFAFTDPAALGSVAIVIHYKDKTTPGALIPRPEGEPILAPAALYLINLPKPGEILTSAKLESFRQAMISARLLSAARKLAKADAAGTAPLVSDRIAALLSASLTTAKSAEAAFTVLFPRIQAAILTRAREVAEQLAAKKMVKQARQFRDTYSPARLNREIMRECFASAEAAEYYFPAMPQQQWEQLLRFAIALAPKFRLAVPVKDPETGKSARQINPATGKEEIIREIVDKPQSPAIFQQWLSTRADARFDASADAGATLDFSGMTA